MGHNVILGNQATLASTNFFSLADVLIITSGVINLPLSSQSNIEAYLAQGGNVYLQAEYQSSYSTNQFFADLVSSNGGTFSWIVSFSGDRAPVTVNAPFTAPNAVADMGYFWYGMAGSGTGVAPILTDPAGNELGWTFVFPGGSRLTCNTDQDWVRLATANDMLLMENTLGWLLNGGATGGPVGTAFCDPASINSTGSSTSLSGSFLTGGGIAGGMSDLHLECSDGVPNELGYFLTGSTASDPGFSVSNGYLCLAGGPFYRYNVAGTTSNSVGVFNAAGVLQNFAGTSTVGLPGMETGFDVPDSVAGSVQLITAGSTWHFQVWHRDTPAGSGTSNLSNGLSVTF